MSQVSILEWLQRGPEVALLSCSKATSTNIPPENSTEWTFVDFRNYLYIAYEEMITFLRLSGCLSDVFLIVPFSWILIFRHALVYRESFDFYVFSLIFRVESKWVISKAFWKFLNLIHSFWFNKIFLVSKNFRSKQTPCDTNKNFKDFEARGLIQ